VTDKQKNRTLYEVLGVSRNAKVTEIQLAYNRLREEMKKESSAPDPRLAAMAKVAVETLSHPQKREQYDKTLDALIPVRAPVRRRKSGRGAGIAIAAAALLAAGGGAWYYFMGMPGSKPAASSAGAGMTPQQVADEVAPRIGRLQGALMSGEVRSLGIAVASAENEMVTTCRGFVAGMQLTVKVGQVAQKADLARVNEELDICTISVRGAGTGLKLRGSVAAPSEKLLAIVPHPTGGQPVWRAVSTVKAIEDPKGPALEVKSAEPLENGTPVFDSQARLVGLAVTPHGYGDGIVAALGSSRIPQSRGTIAAALAAEKATATAQSPATPLPAAPAPGGSSAVNVAPAPAAAATAPRRGGRGTMIAEGFTTLWREDDDGQIDEILDDVKKGKIGYPLAYWTRWTGRDTRFQPVHCRIVHSESDVAFADYDQRPHEIEADGYWYCALTQYTTGLDDLRAGNYTFTIYVEGRPVAESTIKVERAILTPTRLMAIVIFVGMGLFLFLRRKREVVTTYGH
jgi:hypothetical protein